MHLWKVDYYVLLQNCGGNRSETLTFRDQNVIAGPFVEDLLAKIRSHCESEKPFYCEDLDCNHEDVKLTVSTTKVERLFLIHINTIGS